MTLPDIQYVTATVGAPWLKDLAQTWSKTVARHVHVVDGETLLAVHNLEPVGILAIQWRTLPPPLAEQEAFIDTFSASPDISPPRR